MISGEKGCIVSANTRKCLLAVVVLLVFSVPFCLNAQAISETFTNQHAAEIICINADSYSDPAPTVKDILGDAVPYETLTHLTGCQMLLRAFGPLSDVQEGGVRDLVKYRSCAFTDVPEEGKAAVDNLTNAGLYIPLDDTKFGPYEDMTKQELCLLIDRIDRARGAAWTHSPTICAIPRRAASRHPAPTRTSCRASARGAACACRSATG